jgi:hypothetical protein
VRSSQATVASRLTWIVLMSTHQARLFLSLALAVVVSASPLGVQMKPKILEAGIDNPTSAIFIGKQLFLLQQWH